VTRSAKTYIDAVIALGAATIAAALLNWHSDGLARFLMFLFSFMVAAILKCRVPGVTGTYSPVFFFALLGSATLSFSEVAIAGAVAGVVQCIWRPRRRPSLIQVCFNAANLSLSSCAGLIVIQRQMPGLTDQPILISLILGASVVYFVNTALVSVVLTLVERGSFADIWKHWCLGSMPYYLIGAMIVAAAVSTNSPVSMSAAILLAPPILLVTLWYHIWLHQAAVQQIPAREAAGISHGS
jgi:hypothetical protein